MRRISALLPVCFVLTACGDDGGAPTTESTGATTVEPTSTGVTPTTGSPTTDASATDASSSTEPVTATTTTGGDTTDATTDATTGTTTGETTGATTDATTGDAAPIVIEGLSHPESILYDATDDVYLISNIGGDPDAVDDDGFIARVNPNGSVDALDWISGAADDVVLDAPKGMALVGDILYVADLTFVRKFDRVTGAPINDIDVDGAVFLNDLSPDGAGNLYASDTLTDTLYRIDPDDQVELVLTDPALAGPNGLVGDASGVTIATYGGPALLRVELAAPAVQELASLPTGELDGLVRLKGGDWLVTSWEAMAIYRVSADLQTVDIAVEGVPSPADIDVDAGRGRVLVPLLLEDRAEFHVF